MSYKSVTEAKRRMDELIIGADFWPEMSPLLETARANFLAAGDALLAEAEPYMWQFYQAEMLNWDKESRLEWGVPVLDSPEEMWPHVEFRFAPEIYKGNDAPTRPHPSYVSFQAQVAWEPEHNMQLVFEQGLSICKVGPFTGHVTHAAAAADESLLGVIYR